MNIANLNQYQAFLTSLSKYYARTEESFLPCVTDRKPVQSYLELLLSVRDIVQPHFQQKAQLSSGHYIVRIFLCGLEMIVISIQDTSLRFIL